ncbi:MAG: heparinase II/III family protein [Armatimonadota bacterium]
MSQTPAIIIIVFCLFATMTFAAADPPWIDEIRPDHPRLFFNADTWPQVRERALTVERGYYDLVKEHAESDPRPHWTEGRSVPPVPLPPTREGSECETADWGPQAMSSALVYRMEPSPERLKRIRDMLWASLDFYHACYDDNRGVNWYCYTRIAWLAAMDWVWNDLDPDERAEMGRSILRHVDEILHKPGIVRRCGCSPSNGNYGASNMSLFAGLLLYEENIDDEAAREYLLEGWDMYQKMLAHRSTMAADDGGAASPTITYSFADYPVAEWNLMYASRSATGVDLAREWDYLAMMPNYMLSNWIPGGREYGYGDVHHVSNSFIGGHWMHTHMSNIMNLYASTEPQWAGLAAAVREMLGTSSDWLARSGRIPYPLLWTDIADAPDPLPIQDYQLPMARYFEAMGQTFMRSGTGPDDTHALFACGGLTGQHRHYDATHFTIYKNGFLALDSGTRRGNTDQLQNYYAQTIAHNCILIKMPGEQPSRYWNGEVYHQAGGQNRSVGSKVIAFETGPHYSYVAGDATPVYHEDKCEMMVRQFVFIPPDHFVVFDRVVSTRAEYAKTWLLHHANEPIFDGKTWHSDQDEGRIFCRTLLPEDAQVEPVGGPGKEFLVEGVNYPLTGGPSPALKARGIAALDYEEVPELMGRWRVEVRPGTPRTHDLFLHLIQVGDQSLKAMADASVTREDDTATISFEAGDRTITISFFGTGEVGGHIRVASDGETILDRALATDVTPQSGLASGG